jgi:hypothetical protein
MKKFLPVFALTIFSSFLNDTNAQNIFSGEPVQVVGAMNGYVTTATYNTTYRRVSVASGTPTDGRGQWAKTFSVGAASDFSTINMPGGAGNGFLFISGPAGNRFQNKWVFTGIGQGTVDGINGISAFNSGNDMGLNMSTSGFYTFVFNDAGYTATNARYYVGYTAAAPATVTQNTQTINLDNSATIDITTSGTGAQEKIYVRYTTGTDFAGTGSSSIVQATTGNNINYSATIPIVSAGTTVRYYIFSSTRSLAQLTANTEAERSLAVLRYDDNSGTNYIYTISALSTNLLGFKGFAQNDNILLKWATTQERGVSHYELEKSGNALQFDAIGRIAATNTSNQADYEYIDIAPINGNNYYRLVTVNNDGERVYSKIFRVIYGKVDNSLSLFPNPVKDVVNIRLVALPKGKYDLAVYNDAGQRVYSANFVHAGNDGIKTINLPAGLKKGPYRLVMSNAFEFYKQSFLVQ